MLRRARGALTVLLGLFLLVAAAIGSAGAAAAADQPAGSFGIRLLDAPSSPADPRASLYIVNRLAPGSLVTRHLELSNSGSQPLAISVYASAADVTKDSFTWADGKVSNELTSWTTLSANTVTVPGGAKRVLSVRIKVPDQVSTGERYGVVWAQVASKPSASGSVHLVNRVGVRMYVSVGSGDVGAANFTLTNLAGHRSFKGVPSVTASVHNTGGRALDLNGTLQLSGGPGGLSAGPFKVTDPATIAADETRTITVPLNRGLPDGPWTAKLSLQAAGVARDVTGQVRFHEADHGTSAAKLGLFIGGPLLLILIIVAVDRMRRRRKRPLLQPRANPVSANLWTR